MVSLILYEDPHLFFFQRRTVICDDLSVTYISEDHPQTPGHFILYGVPGNYSDKKKVCHILFSTKHHNNESEMFSGMNNTYIVRHSSLDCFASMLY